MANKALGRGSHHARTAAYCEVGFAEEGGWGRGTTGELASLALCRVLLSGIEKLACTECAHVEGHCFHLTQFTGSTSVAEGVSVRTMLKGPAAGVVQRAMRDALV